MKTKSPLKHFLLATSLISLGFGYQATSYAAFEWTPPSKVVDAPAPTATPAMETAPDMDPLSPSPVMEEEIDAKDGLTPDMVEEDPIEYIEGQEPKTMGAAIAPAPVNQAVAHDLKEIIQEAEQRNDITPVAAIPETEQLDSLPADPNIVMGFGNNLPLVMAVRQIIPQNKPYAFAKDVDLSTLVSWKGGATWQETLDQIIAEQGLRISYDADAIRIGKQNNQQVAAAIKVDPDPVETLSIVEPPQEKAPVIQEPVPNAITEITQIEQEILAPEEPQSLSIDDVVIAPVEPETVNTPVNNDMTLEEVIAAADAEIKTSGVEKPKKENAFVSAIEETDVAAIEPPLPETERLDSIPVDDTFSQENEVLEASISDAIVISPIENLDDAIVQPIENGELSTISEGTIIRRIDEPVAANEMIAPAAMDNVDIDASDEMMTIEEDINVVENIPAEDLLVEELDVVIIPGEEEILAESTIELPQDSEVEVIEEDILVMPTSDPNVVQSIEDNMPEFDDIRDAEPLDIAMVEEAEPLEMAVPAVAMDDVVKTWKVKKNSDLKSTLEKWSEEAGIQLDWKMEQDYQINYMVWVDGSFQEAISVLMQGYSNEKGLIPVATLGADSNGNPVLIVEPAV